MCRQVARPATGGRTRYQGRSADGCCPAPAADCMTVCGQCPAVRLSGLTVPLHLFPQPRDRFRRDGRRSRSDRAGNPPRTQCSAARSTETTSLDRGSVLRRAVAPTTPESRYRPTGPLPQPDDQVASAICEQAICPPLERAPCDRIPDASPPAADDDPRRLQWAHAVFQRHLRAFSPLFQASQQLKVRDA